MSGGSYDYAYRRIEDLADSLRTHGTKCPSLRAAFAEHLRLVAKAAHAIEWVDSCDYGPGDEVEAIRAVLSPGAEIEAATAAALKVRSELESVLERANALLADRKASP